MRSRGVLAVDYTYLGEGIVERVSLTIELHPKLFDFITELNSSGLYGDTVEDTAMRMVERSAAQLWEKWEGTPESSTRMGFTKGAKQ